MKPNLRHNDTEQDGTATRENPPDPVNKIPELQNTDQHSETAAEEYGPCLGTPDRRLKKRYDVH